MMNYTVWSGRELSEEHLDVEESIAFNLKDFGKLSDILATQIANLTSIHGDRRFWTAAAEWMVGNTERQVRATEASIASLREYLDEIRQEMERRRGVAVNS